MTKSGGMQLDWSGSHRFHCFGYVLSRVIHGTGLHGCVGGAMRGNCKSMAFALNVSVSYLAYVAYKNLPVSRLKHAVHKNIMPKFSSYVTINLLHYKDNIVNSVSRTNHCLV